MTDHSKQIHLSATSALLLRPHGRFAPLATRKNLAIRQKQTAGFLSGPGR